MSRFFRSVASPPARREESQTQKTKAAKESPHSKPKQTGGAKTAACPKNFPHLSRFGPRPEVKGVELCVHVASGRVCSTWLTPYPNGLTPVREEGPFLLQRTH